MTAYAQTSDYTFNTSLPNQALFERLIPCPKCKAKFAIAAVRKGPAVIMITSNKYQVICLSCWHKSKSSITLHEAIGYWNDKKFPSKLRFHRERLGLTQRDLSALSGVGTTAISRIEQSRQVPTEDIRLALSSTLGVCVNEI